MDKAQLWEKNEESITFNCYLFPILVGEKIYKANFFGILYCFIFEYRFGINQY